MVAKTPKRLNKVPQTQILAVKKVLIHPLYDAKDFHNDIGLLKMKDEITLDGIWAEKIRLPNMGPIIHSKCTVIGWGCMYEV